MVVAFVIVPFMTFVIMTRVFVFRVFSTFCTVVVSALYSVSMNVSRFCLCLFGRRAVGASARECNSHAKKNYNILFHFDLFLQLKLPTQESAG